MAEGGGRRAEGGETGVLDEQGEVACVVAVLDEYVDVRVPQKPGQRPEPVRRHHLRVLHAGTQDVTTVVTTSTGVNRLLSIDQPRGSVPHIIAGGATAG
ncbi:hypothetical protein [Streptomyces sp. NPDC018045]|uniref:hypothetical protein n=1 Tax=Streptomyces sp. NPDC018045 TaxID=3365037 RepID=UPI0037A50AA0